MPIVLFVVLVALHATSACDCNYKKAKYKLGGGCIIVKPAPAGKACRCIFKGFWTCGGQVVPCDNPNNSLCKKPSTTFASCRFGQGDCDGYY